MVSVLYQDLAAGYLAASRNPKVREERYITYV